MPLIIPTTAEKCRGAMVATAIGDALGWPNERVTKNKKAPVSGDDFVEWTRVSKTPRWHSETIGAGNYSDDTQLTLAVARSIIAGDWERSMSERELPFWLEYERGGGGALLRAASCWKNKKCPIWKTSGAKTYFSAGGNGAAMRILPHVIAGYSKNDIKSLLDEVFSDAILTHGHPRAILGAMCYAYALNYLLRKDSSLEYGELIDILLKAKLEWSYMPFLKGHLEWYKAAQEKSGFDYYNEWESTAIRMSNQLSYIQESLKKGLLRKDEDVLKQLEALGVANGAGDVAILCAAYFMSKYANNPDLAISIPACTIGIDTDTIGSMTGGLVGMLSGIDWIPAKWDMVQDRDCLVQIADLLLSDNKTQAAKDATTGSQLHDPQIKWDQSPIGKARRVGSINAPNGKQGMVEISEMKTAIGQSFFTKRFIPNGKTESVPRQSEQYTMFSNDPSKEIQKEEVNTPSMQSSLILNERAVNEILNCPALKKKMTVEKMLKVILSSLDPQKSDASISKEYKVDLKVVQLIKKYIV